jgi:glutathione S-transferase
MKLYYHPGSTVSRPVMLFAADSGIALECEVVDLTAGEQMGAPYARAYPSQQVPALEDGDFRLSESSAILKYLADTIDSPAYPRDLRRRARVNEMMDWLNTGLYRDFGFGLVYPQVFPQHRRRSDESNAATVDWANRTLNAWLLILDEQIIGPANQYLLGNEITIADYFGAGLVPLVDAIRCDMLQFPNVARWFDTMRSRPSWAKANEAFYDFTSAAQGKASPTT